MEDKSWMTMDRLSTKYANGVETFISYAEDGAEDLNSIRCPCTECDNLFKMGLNDIRYHLLRYGIKPSYTRWVWHGEGEQSEGSSTESIYQDHGVDMDDATNTIDMFQAVNEDFVGNPKNFQNLLEDAEKPLYEDCRKYTKLSAVVKLFNIKAKAGWSDKSFSDVLTLFADMLPENNELPLSTREAKRILFAFGMEYKKIHACSNDCILYRKEYEHAIVCPTCGMPRYKAKENVQEEVNDRRGKGVPAKVLWYFSPIPRFKRWFQSTQTEKDLTWHASGRDIDGQLRHPADSPTWKLIDDKWPEFASESRNLRLAISADGINPHSSLSSRYSCWPVMLNTYNLPPWLCMKRKFIILTMLISGPKQPRNDIDVYLAPLIDDLKTLWEEGVCAYDAYRWEHFTLRAVVMWTINDFPAYGNLSGCATKGYYACPICNENTYSHRLKNCGKNIYMGHRRYLPRNHPFRNQKKAFNGEQEFGSQPEPMSGQQMLLKVGGINVSWGKKNGTLKKSTLKRKKEKHNEHEEDATCWKKKSIFSNLEYWKHLPLRHILDVMHIEKNVFESIIGTLLNIPGKTKDGEKSRKDLVELGLRKELGPQVRGNRTYLPAACYTLSRVEKRMVCETLHNLKVPDGYSSNFKSHISMKDLKLYSLKSHDHHILMQQVLPVAIRAVLPKHVRYAIIRVCFFFNALCVKVVDVQRLKEIQKDVVITLCLLEKYFPPSLFDIMIHLMVHLVREVELCGPVFF